MVEQDKKLPESDKIMDDNIGHPEKLIEEMLAHSLMMIKTFQENMENLLQKKSKMED